MRKWVLITGLLIASIKGIAQLDSITIKKIAAEISREYTPTAEDGLFMDPVPILQANLKVLANTKSTAWKTLRKLELSRRYKSDEEILDKVIPVVNMEFLRQYYVAPLRNTDHALNVRLTNLLCDCFKAKAEGVEMDRSMILQCWRSSPDTNLWTDYQKFVRERWDVEQNAAFITEQLSFAYIYCDTLFRNLMELVSFDLQMMYAQFKSNHKTTLLVESARLHAGSKKDSLMLLFPNHNNFSTALNQLSGLYKKSGQTLEFMYEYVFSGNNFERYSALITDPARPTAHILGQAVFEVGTDKEQYYLRKITFYNRESLQNLTKLEQQLNESRKAYKEWESGRNNDE